MLEKFEIKVGETQLPIVQHEIKKGQTKGKIFYGPDFNSLDSLKAVGDRFGEDKILNDIVIPELRRLANIVTKEALAEVTGKEKDGQLEGNEQEEAFVQRYQEMYADLSPRGLTMAALKERIQDLTEELRNIKPKVGANGVPDLNDPETLRFFKVGSKLQLAQTALVNKRAQDEVAEPATTAPAVA